MSSPDETASTWFEFGEPAKISNDPFWAFGGKDARIRVIPVIRKKDQTDQNGIYVNCTSSGNEDEHQLSPFFLGPCRLYGNHTAKKMENGWQFSKVYPQHVGTDDNPNADYFEWAKKGWSAWRAERYPMGKGVKASFHWWDGQHLDKVEARKIIYAPLYAEHVIQKPYFQNLKKVWAEDILPEPERTLYLMDFDAYEYGTSSFSQVLNDPNKSMGHGFVLAMLLTNDAALQECEIRSSS